MEIKINKKKASKTKKSSNQGKGDKEKCTEIPLSSFYAGQLLLGM